MTSWQQWLDHPEKGWFRYVCFPLHFWIGAAVGAYVLLMSLSGSVLVYRNELGMAAGDLAGDDTGATRDSIYLTRSAAQHGVNDAAIDGVIASNFQAADADSEAALSVTRTTLTVLIALSGLGLLLAAWAIAAVTALRAPALGVPSAAS